MSLYSSNPFGMIFSWLPWPKQHEGKLCDWKVSFIKAGHTTCSHHFWEHCPINMCYLCWKTVRLLHWMLLWGFFSAKSQRNGNAGTWFSLKGNNHLVKYLISEIVRKKGKFTPYGLFQYLFLFQILLFQLIFQWSSIKWGNSGFHFTVNLDALIEFSCFLLLSWWKKQKKDSRILEEHWPSFAWKTCSYIWLSLPTQLKQVFSSLVTVIQYPQCKAQSFFSFFWTNFTTQL